jgi:DNA-binding MarR family transcriptional regulator
MTQALPLSALLSRVLVAFTIEFDNEFEHRMPHRTAWGPAAHSGRGPFLASMAMWANFLQDVLPEGVPLRDLADQVRLTNLAGMERWSYVTVAPDPADPRAKPPRTDWIVRPATGGRAAQEIWRPLAGEIEGRWRERFGVEAIDDLREGLGPVADRLELELPRFLPVLLYSDGMMAPRWFGQRAPVPGESSGLDLSVLLSRVLLAFTLDFERESSVSLALTADLLRVIPDAGVHVRQIPGLSGVSKEAVSAALGFLERHGYVTVEPDPLVARTKSVRLTARGSRAQAVYRRLPDQLEAGWRERFGGDVIDLVRASLEGLVGGSHPASSPLDLGLRPYPDSWRAALGGPGRLPDYPMVLHRGGFPDGS